MHSRAENVRKAANRYRPNLPTTTMKGTLASSLNGDGSCAGLSRNFTKHPMAGFDDTVRPHWLCACGYKDPRTSQVEIPLSTSPVPLDGSNRSEQVQDVRRPARNFARMGRRISQPLSLRSEPTTHAHRHLGRRRLWTRHGHRITQAPACRIGRVREERRTRWYMVSSLARRPSIEKGPRASVVRKSDKSDCLRRYENRYPGATSDLCSHVCQFCFEPNPKWSHL